MDPTAPEPEMAFGPRERRGVLPLLFLVSLATIALQVVQVRIFSYTINHAFVYMAISLAMLGFGASGSVLSVFPRLLKIPPSRSVPACVLMFALLIVGVQAVYARNSTTVVPTDGLTIFSSSAALLLIFSIPYFFAGAAVALALLTDRQNVGRNYFVNLVGSAAGCFVIYPFLGPLGASGVVAGMALVCAVGVVLFAPGGVRVAGIASTVLLGAAYVWRADVMPFQPDVFDQYSIVQGRFSRIAKEPVESELEFERWDPVGKIEIFRWPEPFNLLGGEADSLFFIQDAGAGSVLMRFAEHPELRDALADGTLYGVASNLIPDAEALIIGLGGGPDLIATLANGAKHVTGAEINRGTLEVLGEEFRDFLGLPPDGSARLDLVLADGRSFVRQSPESFDIIQMTGADTNAASASGGSILVENYLYSTEAFVDYLRALKTDGIISITRFGQESFRVVTTMAEALRELGIEDIGRHMAVINQGQRWGGVLVKREPFTAEEVAQLDALCAASQPLAARMTIPVYDPIGFELTSEMRMLLRPSLGPGRAELDAYVDKTLAMPDRDYAPITDDRPFFFNFTPITMPALGDVFGGGHEDEQPGFGVADYLVIAIQFSIVALILILGPVIAFRTRGVRTAGAAPLALYFLGIGVGFMFLELVLMQKCGLFMGHPNYSISTVLFALLVFSGIGSFVSGKLSWKADAKIAIAVLGIAAWVALFSTFSQDVFETYLAESIVVRTAILAAMIAPVGFFAGWPFPTCLSYVQGRVPHFAPWALGTNGFASVVASLAAIPTSMAIGFSNSLYCALGAYAIAALGYALFRRRG